MSLLLLLSTTCEMKLELRQFKSVTFVDEQTCCSNKLFIITTSCLCNSSGIFYYITDSLFLFLELQLVFFFKRHRIILHWALSLSPEFSSRYIFARHKIPHILQTLLSELFPQNKMEFHSHNSMFKFQPNKCR